MLKNFPENAFIRSMGTIYREQKNKAWMIELQLNDLMSKKKYPVGVRFSNMHLLARQRC